MMFRALIFFILLVSAAQSVPYVSSHFVGPSTQGSLAETSAPSQEPLSLPVIGEKRGATRKGALIYQTVINLAIPVFLTMSGLPAVGPDIHVLCDVNYCLFGESKGQKAYVTFSHPNARPETIVHSFLSSQAGGRCFLFCNRYSFFDIHHKGFVRTFLTNFGPMSPGQALDTRGDIQAIFLLAAFLNMRSVGLWGEETFLQRFLRNVPNDDVFCRGHKRCTWVMEGLRSYLSALKQGQKEIVYTIP